MRKIISILTIIAFCMTLTACQDNSPVEGYWIMTEAEIYGKKINIDELSPDGKYPFISLEENSKYVVFFVREAIKGKWERTKKGVKLFEANENSPVEIEKVGDKLVMNISTIGAKYVFTRSNEKPTAYDDVVK